MVHLRLILLCSSLLCLRLSAQEVTLWYGPVQYAGQRGEPQRWVNVLGQATESAQLRELSYRLNDGPEQPLHWGSDQHRLAQPGDFNVELAWDSLQTGPNTVAVIGRYRGGREVRTQTTLHIQRGQRWPLPYTVDFAQVDTLQRAVQVVDGHWQLTETGVRTVVPYYDRVLSLGDSSWRDYEALVHLTLHGFTPPEPGPPTYNVTHFGVALRWRGHHQQPGYQPSRKWYPLGAQGEFLLKNAPDSCHWRILYDAGPGTGGVPHTYSDTLKTYRLEQPMYMRAQVRTLPNGDTRYRFKQWLAGMPEPIAWDIEGDEPATNGDYPSGSLCLVPHNSDVTIHRVEVQPLQAYPWSYATRPGPGALHRSAPLGGVMGAVGEPFEVEVLPAGQVLRRLQVCLGPPPLGLVRGLRFATVDTAGEHPRVITIGETEGAWQPWYEVGEGQILTGISGASGWAFDAIQFHFQDGSRSPRYGGSGGDTAFALDLRQPPGRAAPRWRGFYGTLSPLGLETLGLLFDPHD